MDVRQNLIESRYPKRHRNRLQSPSRSCHRPSRREVTAHQARRNAVPSDRYWLRERRGKPRKHSQLPIRPPEPEEARESLVCLQSTTHPGNEPIDDATHVDECNQTQREEGKSCQRTMDKDMKWNQGILYRRKDSGPYQVQFLLRCDIFIPLFLHYFLRADELLLS